MTLTASKYARVLWEVSMPVELVHEIVEVMRTEEALRAVLVDPEVPIEGKYRVIERVFPEKAHNFLKILCREKEIGQICEIEQAYQKYWENHQNALVAKLYYVTPPNEEQLNGMMDFLKKQYSVDNVRITQIEDKQLIGGFILEANDQEYDWSLRGRLENLENKLIRR